VKTVQKKIIKNKISKYFQEMLTSSKISYLNNFEKSLALIQAVRRDLLQNRFVMSLFLAALGIQDLIQNV